MEKTDTIKVSEDGNVYFVYKDDHILSGEGFRQEVRRATNVEFDEHQQAWSVVILFGVCGKQRLPQRFKNRQDAIDFEVELLNTMVGNGDLQPSKMFETSL